MPKLKLLPLLFILISCVENTPVPDNKENLIAGNSEFGKTWRIAEIEIELGTLQPKSCVTDNFITYYPNGNYEINEGASKCDPNDPPAIEGVWQLNSFETKIFVEFGDSVQVWDIESINRTNQRITSDFVEGERTYSLLVVN